jgi:hypothetical protein
MPGRKKALRLVLKTPPGPTGLKDHPLGIIKDKIETFKFFYTINKD